MTTFALEGLFDEVRRLLYLRYMNAVVVASIAERDAIVIRTDGMRVVVVTDNGLDEAYQLGSDLTTWVKLKIPVTVLWGRLEPPKNTNVGTHGRIVFVPNAADGSLGALEAPEQPGRFPRPLFSQPRKFQIFVYGRNELRIDSQRSNDHIVELLLHDVATAVYRASHHWGDNQVTSPVDLGEPQVLKPTQQLPNGVEYRIPATVQSAIVDQFDDAAEFVLIDPMSAEVTVNHQNPFVVEPE